MLSYFSYPLYWWLLFTHSCHRRALLSFWQLLLQNGCRQQAMLSFWQLLLAKLTKFVLFFLLFCFCIWDYVKIKFWTFWIFVYLPNWELKLEEMLLHLPYDKIEEQIFQMHDITIMPDWLQTVTVLTYIGQPLAMTACNTKIYGYVPYILAHKNVPMKESTVTKYF